MCAHIFRLMYFVENLQEVRCFTSVALMFSFQALVALIAPDSISMPHRTRNTFSSQTTSKYFFNFFSAFFLHSQYFALIWISNLRQVVERRGKKTSRHICGVVKKVRYAFFCACDGLREHSRSEEETNRIYVYTGRMRVNVSGSPRDILLVLFFAFSEFWYFWIRFENAKL